jgi:hypothetical protein
MDEAGTLLQGPMCTLCRKPGCLDWAMAVRKGGGNGREGQAGNITEVACHSIGQWPSCGAHIVVTLQISLFACGAL